MAALRQHKRHVSAPTGTRMCSSAGLRNKLSAMMYNSQMARWSALQVCAQPCCKRQHEQCKQVNTIHQIYRLAPGAQQAAKAYRP